MEEKLYFLGLYIKEKGAFKCTKLNEDFSLFEKFVEEKKLKLKHLKEIAEQEIEKAEKQKIHIIFIKDEKFPEELRVIPYPPPFIYVKGRLSNSKKIAIVGSRKPSSYGKEVASLFAKELSQAGICLVSGLARGIDTIVHQVSLNNKGETIAILGSGLDVIYPPENKKLFEKIVEQAGAGISEFPLGTKPKRENFPRRNRLISGLSSGVLIIEAGERSGTLITAKWAQEQGKEVFVIPGNIFSEQSRGTHLLLKEGAIPVTQPNEILEYLGISVASCQGRRVSEDLSPEEEKVLQVLSLYPLQLEEIVAKTGLSLDTLLPLLTELEIKNFIRCLSGKFYQLNPSCLPHLKQ